MASTLPLCSSRLPLIPAPAIPSTRTGVFHHLTSGSNGHRWMTLSERSWGLLHDHSGPGRRFLIGNIGRSGGGATEEQQALEEGRPLRRVLQIALWVTEAIYIIWLFLLPYAPGDPVWAIKSSTVNELVGLSLNFFFVLPFLNSVGINVIEAPVLHPMSEGLFNFVIAWTLLFAPLLFTDSQRDRYKGSLDLLWGFQMFLTNTFLIPYMAIRLNDPNSDRASQEQSQLGLLMTQGAPIVALIGGAACIISIFWAYFGRTDGSFGDFADRSEFLVRYLGSERLAYAFIWDIVLYAIFQPWLIGDNLQNVKINNKGIVNKLRFIPVVGLVAYILNLNYEKKL